MNDIRPLVTCVIFILLCTLGAVPLYSQGCSDAGFCTIGNLNQHKEDSVHQGQKITLLLPIGQGDEKVFVFTPGIQYDNQLSKRWAVQAKITANYAEGNLGSASGLGDLFASGTHTWKSKSPWKTSFTLGTKLPLNRGNITKDGKSLPMQYQSSLGTIDIIAGLAIATHSWQFSAGWQQPLSGINRNHFLPAYWNMNEANNYPPSNDFKRKGDVLVRGAYLFTIKQVVSFTAGLLGIYHLAEDTYVDANGENQTLAIQGSQGLTLNATVAAFWKINSKVSFGFSGGAPLVYREVRPDGLTRKFVFAPEIRMSF